MNQVKVSQNSFTFNAGDKWIMSNGWTYYWHVQPVDRQNNAGEWKTSTFEVCDDTWVPCTPQMFHPQFYYQRPVENDTFVDRTVAIPTFMWSALPNVITSHLQVGATQNVSESLVWEIKTQNVSATPITTTNPFTDGETYYWHVRVYSGTETGGSWRPWSERWLTRIDTSRLATPTLPPPRLLRPTYKSERREGSEITYTFSYEALDHWPNFEWQPVQGAAQYRIQISDDPADFSDPVDEAVTGFTNYTPVTKHPWGTYYWRVRAEDGDGTPLGTDPWSEVYCLIVERPFRPVPDSGVVIDGVNDFGDWNHFAADPAGDAEPAYDLENLYLGLSVNHWNLGFDAVTTDTTPVRYGVYVDTNHGDELGAPGDDDPRVTSDTVKAHYPDLAVYWELHDDSISRPTLYTWNEGSGDWDRDYLDEVGGSAAYSQTAGFLELAIPRGAVYFQPGRLAYSPSFLVFAADPTTGQVKDTVPSNQGALLKGFRTVSLSPVPVMPPANPADDADNVVHPLTPLLAWHALDSACIAEYGYGEYGIQVALDYGFTSGYAGYYNKEVPKRDMLYACHNSVLAPKHNFNDNPTYYWRLMSLNTTVWGHSVEFSKVGYTPDNRRFDHCTVGISGTVTYVDRTPTFRWDPVEGAADYRIEVAGPLSFNRTTTLNAYTSIDTFPNGSYLWRVTARFGADNPQPGTPSSWISFQKVYTTVTPIRPLTPDQIGDTLQFEWYPARDAAYYDLQIASDRNFSRNLNTFKTYNATFTPPSVPAALKSGLQEFYWRVRLVDGNGRVGDWMSLNLDPHPYSVFLPAVLKD